jgi:predicted metalloendopeptidase
MYHLFFQWISSKNILSGQKEMEPRWKDVVNVIDEYLGDLVGHLYVEKTFLIAPKRHVKKWYSTSLKNLESESNL